MRLEQLPTEFSATRDALHQIAFFAIAPTRYAVEKRMGLTAAPGGFGTPEFAGKVARVEGSLIVLESDAGVASQTISTVRNACAFFGRDYQVDWYTDFHDPLAPVDPDGPLAVEDAAARSLGQWFAFGTDVLERLRTSGSDDDDPSPVQLWPEHFDPATELGDPEKGRRASFGASPGDRRHVEPYLYVAPWGEVDSEDPYWNDDAFGGASLGYADLARSEDPIELGLEFLLRGHRLLHTS